ncbi:MAG: T9SS type A sorting domain-containing protein [Chitinophagales bacterium]|nr:T9SS type A sorting domain-containing protein [Chitinophagales bacterium]
MNYNFSATSGTYAALSSGTTPTLLPTTSGGSTDEGYANNLPIGFTFIYNGNNYTTFGICTNGFIYLGSAGIANNSITYNNNLSIGLPAARPIIAPLWDDIDVQTTTNIKYLVSGSAPNRVLTIEWANALWDPFAAAPAISFQVKLYETTNVIEFIYKQEAGNIEDNFGGVGASIGITATATGTGNFLSLNNSSNNPSVSSSLNTNDIITKPATGQIYRFTPLIPCSGTPNAGTASASVNTTCSSVIFNLMLNGYSSQGGISLQWQSSPTGQNNWSDLGGVITDYATIAQIAASDYRCKVTCIASSTSSYSNVITVGISSGVDCVLANDECSGAITITQGAYEANCSGANFNTSLATQSSNPSSFFGGSQDDDVWYKFITTADKAVIKFENISAVSGATGNIAFAFYSGTACAGLTDLGGTTVNINSGKGEALYDGLTVGNTYYIRVVSSGTNWRAQGTICVTKPQIVVPIIIQYFSGKKNGNSNILQWQTMHEINTTAFDIQRSADGIHFSSIASVLSKADNASTTNSYEFYDNYILAGNNFYRLKQVDKDGSAYYSSIILLKNLLSNQPHIVNVFPNPVKNILQTTLYLPQPNKVQFSINDLAGKIVLLNTMNLQEGEVSTEMNISALSKGIYILKVVSSNGILIGIQKIVKE